MSHTTIIGLKCTMSDLQNNVVQDILSRMGWKIVTPEEAGLTNNIYRGYDRQNTTVSKVILVPREQAGNYGVDLPEGMVGQLGLKGGTRYKVIGLREGKPVPAVRGVAQPPPVEIVADDFQAGVKEKVMGAIKGGIAVRQATNAISRLPSQYQGKARAAIEEIKTKVAQSASSGQQAHVKCGF